MRQSCVVARKHVTVQHDVLSEHIYVGDCVTSGRHAATTSSLVQGTAVSVIWAAGWTP